MRSNNNFDNIVPIIKKIIIPRSKLEKIYLDKEERSLDFFHTKEGVKLFYDNKNLYFYPDMSINSSLYHFEIISVNNCFSETIIHALGTNGRNIVITAKSAELATFLKVHPAIKLPWQISCIVRKIGRSKYYWGPKLWKLIEIFQNQNIEYSYDNLDKNGNGFAKYKSRECIILYVYNYQLSSSFVHLLRKS